MQKKYIGILTMVSKKAKNKGKFVCNKSSNDVGKKVNKKKLGKGRRKHVGYKFCKKGGKDRLPKTQKMYTGATEVGKKSGKELGKFCCKELTKKLRNKSRN